VQKSGDRSCCNYGATMKKLEDKDITIRIVCYIIWFDWCSTDERRMYILVLLEYKSFSEWLVTKRYSNLCKVTITTVSTIGINATSKKSDVFIFMREIFPRSRSSRRIHWRYDFQPSFRYEGIKHFQSMHNSLK